MSTMSELMLSIQEELMDGNLTYKEIAKKYGVPLEWVRAAAIDNVSDFTEYEYDDKPF